jgi:hypothetical protein
MAIPTRATSTATELGFNVAGLWLALVTAFIGAGALVIAIVRRPRRGGNRNDVYELDATPV